MNPETNDNSVEVTTRRPWNLDEIELLLLQKKSITLALMPTHGRKLLCSFQTAKQDHSSNLKYREIIRNCNEYEIT